MTPAQRARKTHRVMGISANGEKCRMLCGLVTSDWKRHVLHRVTCQKCIRVMRKDAR